MSEFKYWTCDRCGKKSEPIPDRLVSRPGEADSARRISLFRFGKLRRADLIWDLCAHCSKSFNEWTKAAYRTAP